jgi:hypothetical protein
MRTASILRSGAARLLVVLACAAFVAAFSPSAMALSVFISSPADGAEYHPGDPVSVTASFSGSVAGAERFTITLEDDLGTLDGFYMDYDMYPPTTSDTLSDSITIPSWVSTPQNLTIRAVVTDYVDPSEETSVSILVTALFVDTTPPQYTGASGIISATRSGNNTAADLTWNAATDDVSASSAIKYNIYSAATQAGVFSGSPVKTVTGATSGQVTGLNAQTHYYFGVRAEDEAENEEANVNTALARHSIEPAYGTIEETFSNFTESVLDSADPETIGTASVTTFVWGGYCAGGSGAVSMTSSGGLQFVGAAKSAGSYAYTRFGKPSLPGGLSNAPETILNMTGNRAKAEVELNTSIGSGYDSGTQAALMLRDNAGWWQSSAFTLEENPSTANTSVLQFNGSSAVTWTHLLDTSDVDQVDDDGETALTEGTTGTPNLGRVEGMGVRILTPSGGSDPLYIRSITLVGTASSYTASDPKTWNLYR